MNKLWISRSVCVCFRETLHPQSAGWIHTSGIDKRGNSQAGWNLASLTREAIKNCRLTWHTISDVSTSAIITQNLYHHPQETYHRVYAILIFEINVTRKQRCSELTWKKNHNSRVLPNWILFIAFSRSSDSFKLCVAQLFWQMRTRGSWSSKNLQLKLWRRPKRTFNGDTYTTCIRMTYKYIYIHIHICTDEGLYTTILKFW